MAHGIGVKPGKQCVGPHGHAGSGYDEGTEIADGPSHPGRPGRHVDT